MALTQLTGEVLDEKYRIERELGRGGMGSVYLATHLGTDRPVAVKVIAPQFMMNDEFVERFRREAKAAGRMHHPNVVNVTDFGFARVGDDRIAYLVMEYLDGCTLADILAEESQLPIEWVADIIEQTCSAVDEAHQHGVVHRDLKPDNIWLEPNRRGGYTVKVLDFGLAKLGEVQVGAEPVFPAARPRPDSARPEALTAVTGRTTEVIDGTSAHAADTSEAVTQALRVAPEEPKTLILSDNSELAVAPAKNDASEAATQLHPPPAQEAATRIMGQTTAENVPRQTMPADGLTRVGSILGTPLYMSPEQCSSGSLDTRSDIYSLGVIAYQMLAGECPFTGPAAEVMLCHLITPPPPLRQKRRKVPKKMAAVIMSALAKDPAERPATAAGFASALRASSEGTGALMRRAFGLYIEHFPKFFRVTFLMYLPLIALQAALLINGSTGTTKTQIAGGNGVTVTTTAASIMEMCLGLLTFVVNFLINAIIAGVTIRLVTQIFLSPLRPLSLRVAYKAVRKRLKPLLTTLFRAGIKAVIGLCLLVVPGIIIFINNSLAAPVVMMEGLRGKAALKRSKTLVKRARRTVIVILFIQWLIPTIIASSAAAFIAVTLKMSSAEHARLLTARITGMMTAALNMFFVPFIATLTALLYLKTRQIGGETLKEALSEFEEEDVPRTKWQMRMRERLQTTSKA